MNEEIKVGDAVTLQHGGQKMTVGHIENGKCYCDWHDRDGQNQVLGVLGVCLRKISTGDRIEQLITELTGLCVSGYGHETTSSEVTTLVMSDKLKISITKSLITSQD